MNPLISSVNKPLQNLLLFILAMGMTLTEASGQDKNNLIRNGGFEQTITRDNQWDGVDSSKNIKFLPRTKNIMVQGKQEQGRTFSPSIGYEDMDGDGLPDMVIADATGFFYFFKNLGPKDNPEFATGEMIPVFFINNEDTVNTPKLTLSKYSGNLYDIIFGDYLGRIVRIPNSGSQQRPEFKLPNDMANFDLATSKQNLQIPTRADGSLWGNFFAPILVDWNGDGKKDLLIGEGTYSANAIHLFLNEGSDSVPRFSEKNEMILAYGYGREQLVPQVVDWDGDGILDLIIGSREGIVDSPGTLCLYKGKPIPKDATRVPQLEFTENIKIGGSVYTTPMATPCVTDYNGDGLPDILIASPSDGRIKVAINKGTKSAPDLATLVNIKAEDSLLRYRVASDWVDTTDINNVGNLNAINQYGIVEVVDTEIDPGSNPAEGKFAMKIHFPKPPMKYFMNNTLVKPDERVITLTPVSPSVILGKNYELSFKVKGKNMKGVLKMSALVFIDEVPNAQNPKVFDAVPAYSESGDKDFIPGSSWKEMTFNIVLPILQPARPNFKYADGKTGKDKFTYTGKPISTGITIKLTGDGETYFDDFKLIEK